MVLSPRRRYRLAAHEIDPVVRAVTKDLFTLVESRNNMKDAEILFKVLWRFDNYRQGPPKYPKNIGWELIANYLTGL